MTPGSTRRAAVLNEERLALLEELHRRYDGRPPVAEVINAFVGPLIMRSSTGGPGWKSYFALMAQVNNSWEWSRLMTHEFDRLVDRFTEAIRTSLPDADPRDIYWSYHFLTGALTHTFAETGRLDRLSGGLCKSSDPVAVNERFARYMAAGFTELAGDARSGAGPASRRKRAARTGVSTLNSGRGAAELRAPRPVGPRRVAQSTSTSREATPCPYL